MATVNGTRVSERHSISTWRVPRTRGAASGVLVLLLGAWGALVPFIGPRFGYAYTPNAVWTMTQGRLWLEVIPGAVAVLGGLILIGSASRAIGLWAGWMTALAGAWFAVGPIISKLWTADGQPQTGTPVGSTPTQQVIEQIGFFTGLGVVIVFLAAAALGRFSVVGVRDGRVVEQDDEIVDEAPRTEVVEPVRTADTNTDTTDTATTETGTTRTGLFRRPGADPATVNEDTEETTEMPVGTSKRNRTPVNAEGTN
ncbi:MAG TPA: hypothetical protein VFX16_01765 [Pseudonocardiaceae bacterium]|nr:hypothetical protein [Pseudonocardiaceae bacterium]